MNALFSLALALAQQSGPPAPAPTPANDSGPKLFDAARLIVNEEIITDEEVRRAPSMRRANTAEEFQRAQAEVVQSKVRELLESQAGNVLGYDQKLIDRFVQDDFARQREAIGSTIKLADELKAANIDSVERKDDARSHVFGELWEGYITGRYAGPSGRQSRDRFVRPGRLWFEFRAKADDLANNPVVKLDELTLGNRKVTQADLDQIHSTLEQARARIVGGEDFAAVARQLNTGFDERGHLSATRARNLLKNLPDSLEFTTHAAEGDVSEILEFKENDRVIGYTLVKLVERSKSLDFAAASLQNELSKQVLENLDAYRIQVGLGRLADAAFVWPPESFNRATALPEVP